jgi:hypothetical protein
MSLFPRIQSPCPYKGKLGDIMDGDICRLCHREVHDITDLSSAARQALVAGCSDEICVSYRLPVKSALAAMALGASMATPAHAQVDELLATNLAEPESGEYCYEEIIVGGLKKPAEVEWLTADLETDLPEMPVVYDDEPAATTSKASTAETTAPPQDDREPLVKDRPAVS